MQLSCSPTVRNDGLRSNSPHNDSAGGDSPHNLKSPLSYSPYSVMMSAVSSVVFEQSPPANLRKSNFFSFVCRLLDSNNQVLRILSAVCVDFIENRKGSVTLRNGVRYKMKLILNDGTETEDFINVIVVDSHTNEIVPFQGQDRNPTMTRVLLTHESICSRCAASKSCGNKNDTPADPVIQDQTKVKVFLKCNQNCLINAGNPRELRKFKLAVSGTTDLSDMVWAYSSEMFVHNNSKHGRVVKSKSSPELLTDPSISLIWPQPGPLCGGRALLVGRNFTEETHVLFGTSSVHSKMITPDAIQLDVPQVSESTVVMVSIIQRSQLFQRGWRYAYCNSDANLPPTFSSNRLNKQFYDEAEQLATFSSMLGISRDRQPRNYAPQSPTYPPPPLKPIPLSANTESEEVHLKTPADDTQFSFSKEGSAFNRVGRDPGIHSIGLVPPANERHNAELSKSIELSERSLETLSADEAARLETATILHSLKTPSHSHVSQNYVKMEDLPQSMQSASQHSLAQSTHQSP